MTLLSALFIMLLVSTFQAGAVNPVSVREQMEGMALHPVEGLWTFSGEEAMMQIVRSEGSDSPSGAKAYDMILVNPSDRSIEPGTKAGELYPTSREGVYECRIFTTVDNSGPRKVKARRYTVALTDSGSRLSMKETGRKLRIRWWRLMPYMFRFVITETGEKAPDAEGLVKVWPRPQIPLKPVYL